MNTTFRAGHRQSGMTLIEVLVVIVIIGMIAALVVPNVIGQSDRARVDLAHTNIQSIANALDLYRLDNGRYPTTQEGLRALVERPVSARNWNPEGYLREVPTDPWGNPYQYISPGSGSPFDLLSLGADGQEGGSGYDADISFHSDKN